jgi:hypothetical protein
LRTWRAPPAWLGGIAARLAPFCGSASALPLLSGSSGPVFASVTFAARLTGSSWGVADMPRRFHLMVWLPADAEWVEWNSYETDAHAVVVGESLGFTYCVVP